MSANQKLSMSKQAIKRREARAAMRLLKQKCQAAAPKPKRKTSKAKAKVGSFATQTKVESGVDVIGVITLEQSMKVGQSLLNFVVNPKSLPGTRLGQYTQLWSRWSPLKLRLEVRTAAGKMIPGSYTLAWFADPTETLLKAGSANVTKLVSSGCSVQQPVGNSATLNIPTATSRKFYAFRGDAFDDSHGVILGCLSGTVTVVGSVTLTVQLHWTIKFDGPNLPVKAEELYITPESDYAGVFTDSVSDWASGTRLTFKHSVGGSVVPWENVEAGVVYSPVEGVKIPYYDSNGVAKECKFFSKMLGASQYDRALVCHASSADASAYQKNADVSKVLLYNKAGEWSTPDLPTLKGESVALAHLHLTPNQPQPLSRVRLETDAAMVSSARPALVTPERPLRPPDIDYEYLAELVAQKLRGPLSEASSFDVLTDPNERPPLHQSHQ